MGAQEGRCNIATVRELIVHWGFSVDDKQLTALESSLGDIASVAKTVGVAVVGAAGTLFGLAEGARRTIDDLDEMATAVGVNTEFFAEFTAAAALGGASAEESAGAIAKLSRNLTEAREGNKDTAKSFRELGISQEDLTRLPTEAILAKIANGMQGIEDPAKRVQLAQALLGRGGTKLIPTLVGGADAMAKLGEQAREFGLVPGPEAIEAANQMEAAMAKAKGVVAGLGLTVGTALMPVVTEVAERFAKWTKENRALILTKLDAFIAGLKIVVEAAWNATVGFVGAMRTLVDFFQQNKSAANALLAILTALTAAFAVQKVMQFWTALKALRAIMLAVNVAMAANPIGLLVVLMATAAALIIANWSEIKEVVLFAFEAIAASFTVLWSNATIGFAAIKDAALFAWEAIKGAGLGLVAFYVGIWSAIFGAAASAWDRIAAAFTGAVALYKAAWQGVADWFASTVIDPILAGWNKISGVVSRAADFLGIGGGGGGGHSPGRPGSPESKVSPLSTSTGSGAGMGGGSRVVNVESSITVHAAAGMSGAEKEDLESRLRAAAKQVFEQSAREVLSEMA